MKKLLVILVFTLFLSSCIKTTNDSRIERDEFVEPDYIYGLQNINLDDAEYSGTMDDLLDLYEEYMTDLEDNLDSEEVGYLRDITRKDSYDKSDFSNHNQDYSHRKTFFYSQYFIENVNFMTMVIDNSENINDTGVLITPDYLSHRRIFVNSDGNFITIELYNTRYDVSRDIVTVGMVNDKLYVDYYTERDYSGYISYDRTIYLEDTYFIEYKLRPDSYEFSYTTMDMKHHFEISGHTFGSYVMFMDMYLADFKTVASATLIDGEIRDTSLQFYNEDNLLLRYEENNGIFGNYILKWNLLELDGWDEIVKSGYGYRLLNEGKRVRTGQFDVAIDFELYEGVMLMYQNSFSKTASLNDFSINNSSIILPLSYYDITDAKAAFLDRYPKLFDVSQFEEGNYNYDALTEYIQSGISEYKVSN